jgi:hypothetical protein
MHGTAYELWHSADCFLFSYSLMEVTFLLNLQGALVYIQNLSTFFCWNSWSGWAFVYLSGMFAFQRCYVFTSSLSMVFWDIHLRDRLCTFFFGKRFGGLLFNVSKLSNLAWDGLGGFMWFTFLFINGHSNSNVLVIYIIRASMYDRSALQEFGAGYWIAQFNGGGEPWFWPPQPQLPIPTLHASDTSINTSTMPSFFIPNTRVQKKHCFDYFNSPIQRHFSFSSSLALAIQESSAMAWRPSYRFISLLQYRILFTSYSIRNQRKHGQ